MLTPLCTLQNLSLSYPHKQIFKEVTFTLHEGDRIGVLGLNGHGKSSLFKVLMGTQAADTTVPAFIYDRNRDLTILLVPQELPNLRGRSVEDYVFEFYPEFQGSKARLDEIGHMLAEGVGDMDKLLHEQEELYAKLEREGEARIHASYISYLKAFGLSDLSRDVAGLSGGEQRKMALALGLSCTHQVVLWDEPTNHLDLETILKFEAELQSSKKTFMVISHDRSLLNNVVDRIVHIQSGKLKSFQGSYSDYLIHLQEEDARRAKELDRLENNNRRETAWIRRGVKARRTKSKKRIDDYDTLQKNIQSLKALAHKSVSLNLQGSGRKSKVLVEGIELGMRFGDRTLFSGLNFSVAKGDKIALMGLNGVGKSTLLKLLLGQLEPTEGKLKRLDGLDCGHFSQKREALPENQTPWEMLGEGTDYVISNTAVKRHVTSYLEDFLFTPAETKRPIHTFSGGEKNRLQLAQFMSSARDLWIFDEPTNDLDLETIGILEEELRNYQGALVVVGHDRTFIENVTDKCWLLHEGKLEMFDGGWPQAEMYLEAIELEEELRQRKAPGSSGGSGAKGRLSNKERLRLDTIVVDMAAMEAKVKALEESLARVDYADPKASAEVARLQAALAVAQSSYESVFDEWAALEEKSR